MILGTLPAQEQLNGSEPVFHLTRPADGWVQLYDTYRTFSLINDNSGCHGRGYPIVELNIGQKYNLISTEQHVSGYNINISISCIGDGIYTAKLNITFDNTTFDGVSKKLKDANKSYITVKFVHRTYVSDNNDPINVRSPTAFIHILNNSSPSNKNQENSSSGEGTSSSAEGSSNSASGEHWMNSFDAIEGEYATRPPEQVSSTGKEANAGIPVVSSSLQLHVITMTFYAFLLFNCIYCIVILK